MAIQRAFCCPSTRHTFSPSVSSTFSSMPPAMAATCVVESALQTTKCEQIAPSNPERSSDTIFLPFLSSIALTIVSISLSIKIRYGSITLQRYERLSGFENYGLQNRSSRRKKRPCRATHGRAVGRHDGRADRPHPSGRETKRTDGAAVRPGPPGRSPESCPSGP